MSVVGFVFGAVSIGMSFVSRRAASRAHVFAQDGAGDFAIAVFEIVRRPHFDGLFVVEAEIAFLVAGCSVSGGVSDKTVRSSKAIVGGTDAVAVVVVAAAVNRISSG